MRHAAQGVEERPTRNDGLHVLRGGPLLAWQRPGSLRFAA